jgi:hypothetical protein
MIRDVLKVGKIESRRVVGESKPSVPPHCLESVAWAESLELAPEKVPKNLALPPLYDFE